MEYFQIGKLVKNRLVTYFRYSALYKCTYYYYYYYYFIAVLADIYGAGLMIQSSH